MLKNRQELIDYRLSAEKDYAAQQKKIIVCAGTGCVAGGSLNIFDELKRIIEEKGLPVEIGLMEDPHSPGIGLKKSGCHGFCEMGPLVRIEPQGWLYTKVKVEDCVEIIEETIEKGECVDRLAYKRDGEIYREQSEIPFYQHFRIKSTRTFQKNHPREQFALVGDWF